MKKKLLTLLMGTALVMGLAACGGGNDDKGTDKGTDNGTDTVTSDAGAKIFDQKCSGCHGGDLTGGMGPNLTKVGSKYSKDDILGIIKNGKGQMPANVVSGDDANQVAEWLAAKK
ncbi:cytochrome c551 [Neobacillus sp. C211]|jgi:cytochrome c551|uniref:cytochrome c551 n=1 Tax=Bacillaceae TaxID=186817 RepID=UPI001BE67E03|nr:MULTISPECIES: cytochrome c [unclassified Bacillus (in: firmicutes)]MBT2698184.1 cytochrome c [Bacillus sp. ISL-40]MBT2741994.1 cytochrome c [Bacillus sp. ISL-77]